MSMTDPIADMLTRIRNGVMSNQSLVAMPSSKLKLEIARILKDEGFIEDFEEAEGLNLHTEFSNPLEICWREARERPVITGLQRVSRP